MCKLVDAFPEQPLPQFECSDYELQHLIFFPFFLFFSHKWSKKEKKVLSSQRKVLNHVQDIYSLHFHLVMQNFQSPAAAFPLWQLYIAIGMLLHPNKPPKRKGQQ